MTDDLIERLLEPDWHDPACPFLKHCYCDDGAPHDTVRHPLAREAADRIATQQEAIDELVAGLRLALAELDKSDRRSAKGAGKARALLSKHGERT